MSSGGFLAVIIAVIALIIALTYNTSSNGFDKRSFDEGYDQAVEDIFNWGMYIDSRGEKHFVEVIETDKRRMSNKDD